MDEKAKTKRDEILIIDWQGWTHPAAQTFKRKPADQALTRVA